MARCGLVVHGFFMSGSMMHGFFMSGFLLAGLFSILFLFGALFSFGVAGCNSATCVMTFLKILIELRQTGLE